MAGRPPHGNQGNNKGAGKRTPAQKQRTRQTRRSARFNQMAANNIALQDQPQADLYGMMQQQAQADQLRQLQAAQSVYGGAYDKIKDVTAPDFGGIADRLNSSLTSLAPAFAGEAYQPAAESAAGSGLGLSHGAAGNTMLANMESRNAMAQGSAERQAALAGQYAGDRTLQDMQDSLQQYRNQLANLHANDPYQIAQEATRLEDQAMSRKLGMSQIQGDKAFSQYLQDMLSNQASANPRRGNTGPGGGGNPPRNPPPGTGTGPISDTSAGGNQGTRPVVPTDTGSGSDTLPASWWSAQTWNQLPEVIKNTYTREAGTPARRVFRQSAHPSFQNYGDFRDAYNAFLTKINRLYREGHPMNNNDPYGQQLGGIGGGF